MKKEICIHSTDKGLLAIEDYLNNLMSELNTPIFLNYKIQLAVHEAFVNSLIHGNKKNKRKKIKISALQESQKLMISIEDEGEGFDYTNISDVPPDINNESGRGLYLMKKLSDKIIFENKGSKVILCFHLNNND